MGVGEEGRGGLGGNGVTMEVVGVEFARELFEIFSGSGVEEFAKVSGVLDELLGEFGAKILPVEVAEKSASEVRRRMRLWLGLARNCETLGKVARFSVEMEVGIRRA